MPPPLFLQYLYKVHNYIYIYIYTKNKSKKLALTQISNQKNVEFWIFLSVTFNIRIEKLKIIMFKERLSLNNYNFTPDTFVFNVHYNRKS